jgi:deoxyribodipyrimidine photo-lyase
LPELENVPCELIHEPWKMTILEQSFYGVEIGKQYPKPVVDIVESAKVAREKLWSFKKTDNVKNNKSKIIELHTRNKGKKEKKKNENQ